MPVENCRCPVLVTGFSTCVIRLMTLDGESLIDLSLSPPVLTPEQLRTLLMTVSSRSVDRRVAVISLVRLALRWALCSRVSRGTTLPSGAWTLRSIAVRNLPPDNVVVLVLRPVRASRCLSAWQCLTLLCSLLTVSGEATSVDVVRGVVVFDVGMGGLTDCKLRVSSSNVTGVVVVSNVYAGMVLFVSIVVMSVVIGIRMVDVSSNVVMCDVLVMCWCFVVVKGLECCGMKAEPEVSLC